MKRNKIRWLPSKMMHILSPFGKSGKKLGIKINVGLIWILQCNVVYYMISFAYM